MIRPPTTLGFTETNNSAVLQDGDPVIIISISSGGEAILIVLVSEQPLASVTVSS
ncbi:hypothetical protein [Flavobacterium sp. LM5]|uniref:hypothetical protein n=1 Tax=Flavobacterium sp. LM5 TaxID=1938610 RepID=UPI0016708557|nr:hypothetical protein [Flavobacterium sp. LM5]